MFGNVNWCLLRSTGRAEKDSSGYYGAADAKRIDRHLQSMGSDVRLSDQCNSIYELGFDFGQMFTFKVHSSGIMAIRWAKAFSLL